MRTRHPSNTNTPDQEAARTFEATLKRHAQENPECQWELEWFKGCLKKVRRSRKLIDEQRAKSTRPLCDKFVRELTHAPVHDTDDLTSPRSSLLFDHLPEEHEHNLAGSHLAKSVDTIADQARPRPRSLSPQISLRSAISGTPYDEPPSATSSVAPTPKVPGAFFASVQSLVPNNASSPAMRPDVIEPGLTPEPLPLHESNRALESHSHSQTNVPEILLVPDDPTPRFERPSPFDNAEIPRVHSVSPQTSFPGDVPNADAFPIYSSDAGDVPRVESQAGDVQDRSARPNPLRLPGSYAPSEHSITPSQSVEDLTTPIDNKTPTETPISPGLELDLFPKPPTFGVPPSIIVPSTLSVISSSSGPVLSPISPKVPGAYAPSIFDATPAMGTVPLEDVSPNPAFEGASPNPLSVQVSPNPILGPTSQDLAPEAVVEDESTTPTVEETSSNPISREASFNPILAGQTTSRVSRSFPIDETALEGYTPTTELNSPFVLIPNLEQSAIPQSQELGASKTETWEVVSPPSTTDGDRRLDSVSPSDNVPDVALEKVKEPVGLDAEISPASVPAVDVPTQAQDQDKVPVEVLPATASEQNEIGEVAPVQDEAVIHVKVVPGGFNAVSEPEHVSPESKIELPVEEPAPTASEVPVAVSTPAVELPQPATDLVPDVSEPIPTSELESQPAPVDVVEETKPGVVEQDETPTRVSDSVPRPELGSATFAEPEVVQAGEQSIAEVERIHLADDATLVQPEAASESLALHVDSSGEAAPISVPETNADDMPATTAVAPPVVFVQEPAQDISSTQVEKADQLQDATEAHVSVEHDPVPQAAQEVLPEEASLEPQHGIDPILNSEPVTQDVETTLESVAAGDVYSPNVLKPEPEVQTVTPEMELASDVIDQLPVEHSAVVPSVQEEATELEQVAPVAQNESSPDAQLVQSVLERVQVGIPEAEVLPVVSNGSKSIASNEITETVILAQTTSDVELSDAAQDLASPHQAPVQPSSVADEVISQVVERKETITSDSNSMHQPEVVSDVKLPSSEPTNLGASAPIAELAADDYLGSTHDSDSTAETDSIHTPPPTVHGAVSDPTTRAKDLSQEASRLSEKFAAYGDVDDLDNAIELYGQVAEILAPNSDVLDISSYLDLGRMMRVKFEAFYDITDLESAINDALLKAYDILKSNPAHESYCDVLYEFGAASLDQYLYDGSKKAGDDAQRYCEEALNLAVPPSGSKCAAIHSVLSRLHLARFEYLSGSGDAEKAVEHLDAAVNAQPAVESEPKHAESRARALFACYQTGRLEYNNHLDQALALAQEALNRTLEGSVNYPITSTFFAEVLLARYERSHNRPDLDEALGYLEEAVQEVPYVSPEQPWVGERVARALIAKFTNDGNTEDLDDAIAFLEIALNLTVTNPYRRQPRLDAFGGALALRFRHFAMGGSTADDRLREAREVMASGDSI